MLKQKVLPLMYFFVTGYDINSQILEVVIFYISASIVIVATFPGNYVFSTVITLNIPITICWLLMKVSKSKIVTKQGWLQLQKCPYCIFHYFETTSVAENLIKQAEFRSYNFTATYNINSSNLRKHGLAQTIFKMGFVESGEKPKSQLSISPTTPPRPLLSNILPYLLLIVCPWG